MFNPKFIYKIKKPRKIEAFFEFYAVKEGFEPSVHGKAYDSLANCSFRPLRHFTKNPN